MKQFFLLLISTLFLLLSSVPASALDRNTQRQYAPNNIMFINPSTYYNGDACFVDLGDNAKTILNYLMSAGYSPVAAAALTGVMSRESTLKPNILEGGTLIDDSSWNLLSWDNARHWSGPGGFGLMQWTDQEEHINLQKFADSMDMPVTSLELQLMFLVRDLACSKEADCDRLDPNAMHKRDDAYAYFDVESLNKYAESSLEEATFWIARRYTIPWFICGNPNGCSNGAGFVNRSYPAGANDIRRNGGGGYLDSGQQYLDLANELSGSIAQNCSSGAPAPAMETAEVTPVVVPLTQE